MICLNAFVSKIPLNSPDTPSGQNIVLIITVNVRLQHLNTLALISYLRRVSFRVQRFVFLT